MAKKQLPAFEFSREGFVHQFNLHSTYYNLSETPLAKEENLKIVNAVLDAYNETPERRRELAIKHECEVFGEVS